ncbi:MAG TPA: hypothetical protein H9753_01465 [Candidatus Blautia merdavium]|uniref:V-type proton ATPase subunit E n=1 Tax=Candidatus Blautia merdavium TaxID=2838494 RepID=A0A9D2TA13_9FIRM|nr:hypothetical protein [Candidatus Blautia merdavium]
MTGLEKMQSQILSEAESSAKEILDQAKKEAEGIVEEARKRAEAECRRISEKSEAEVKGLEERAVSSSDLQRRKELLQAKQEVISQMLDQAYESLLCADEKDYFDMLRKMLRKFVLPQEGEICFSKEDLERMPKGFQEEIQAIAKEKGGALALSEEVRSVQGGFVLIYGGIEENCTFRAMFNSKKDELSDKVHALLFS